MPPSCPVGGFPFAAEFTYADGSTSSALATAPVRTMNTREKAGTPMHSIVVDRRGRADSWLRSDVCRCARRSWRFYGLAPGAAQSPHRAPARSISLNESGALHLTSRHGFTLNEQGPASGTIRGTIYVHLKIVSTSRVTAEVTIYPNGGSITGYGTASYHREGATASFSGSLSINRGTGSYTHAQGSGLSFSGTMQRSNDAVTVHVSGRVSD